MPESGGLRRGIAQLAPGLVAIAVIVWLLSSKGEELAAAVSACPLWVLLAATGGHALTLVLRSEAWRITLNAIGEERIRRGTVHTANACAFLAGAVQSHAALPVRVGLLRRMAGRGAPRPAQIALADAPIFLLEACLAMALLIPAAGAAGLPPWVAPGALLSLVLILCALGKLGGRAPNSIVAGLRILSDPRRRVTLAAHVIALNAVMLARVWVVLVGFGLPSGPAATALVFVSLGAIGLLPVGVGAGPAATMAALGASSLAAAAAAGVVISATTLAAVLLYAAANLAAHPTASGWQAGRRVVITILDLRATRRLRELPLPAVRATPP
jgi:hypothetical protein